MIVELKHSSMSIKELREEYSLNSSMISRWCREYKDKSGDLSKKRVPLCSRQGTSDFTKEF